jgi:hypothetical protein
MEENKQRGPGYEERDVNVFMVGKFAFALVLMTLFAMALLYGLFRYFQSQSGGQARTADPARTFPQPQLQRTPIPDLKTVRAAEEHILTSYDWVDRGKGVVRIPIDRAMDLLVERGLPARQAAPPSSSDASVPTESGLGAKMTPPGGPLGGGK